MSQHYFYQQPLSRHTSWAVGGEARLLFRPQHLGHLVDTIAQLPAPLAFLGLGSNLWVADGPHDLSVIHTHQALAELRLEEDGLIYAEAGVSAPKLARLAAHQARCGAEFLAGIPGTVGGALRMNAGCYGSSTWDHVVKVLTLKRNGQLQQRSAADFEIGYRHVSGLEADEWFVAAWFDFAPGDSQQALARIKQLLSQRAATQPLNQANAGSVFVNPPNDYAARLIESCGLKGTTLGGAQVSVKHANFIVNPQRQATASDIESLIELVRATVLERSGLRLETEIHFWGNTEK